VLFADRDVRSVMAGNAFDDLKSSTSDNINPKKFDKVEEVNVNTFIEQIVPTATSIELMLENKHEPNLFSLIAPVHTDSANMFKHGNNFSHVYKDEVADSMKKRVKSEGGNVEGILRSNDPYVNNCVLIPRMGEKGMFQIHKGNFISPYLEGYLIMPIEDYDGSLKFKGLKTAQKRIGKK